MSGWHRENPELAGTDADPWMANAAHAAAWREVQMIQRFPNLDAMIAEHERAHRCVWCGSDDTERVDDGDRCSDCQSTTFFSQREDD